MTIKETILCRYRAEADLSLGAAIAASEVYLKGAIALLYAPQSCYLVRLTPALTFRDARDREVDLTNVFEARIFNPQCELRWLNRMDGLGDAVLLMESIASPEAEAAPNIKEFASPDTTACKALGQQYLLWGEKAKNQPSRPSWQRLAEARIGKLEIPLAQPLEEGQRVCLKTSEYLAVADGYGNVAVIEERLMQLEVA
jgi:CRISPR-associated protein (TIGR03984 family)